eukprot:GFUD01023413.1.p1 GENE.GFUD01023413.1~~GFUD01023413.1.p1  ORF type:complete len:146 (+),score=13.75 GFUD01023413.1:84-521(+)
MSKPNTLLTLLMLLVCVKAGFRCSLGESVCSASCKVLGQSGGTCHQDGECFCSELPLDLDSLKALLPSRCQIGASFCASTCNSIGRRDGACNDDNTDCTCSEARLSAQEFALCAAETTCRLDCQRRGLATGVCTGWSCECVSDSL